MKATAVKNITQSLSGVISADVKWDRFPDEYKSTSIQPNMSDYMKTLYDEVVAGDWGDITVDVATEPTESELIAERQETAKETRNTAINSDIEYDGVLWQVSDDANDIRNTISDADLIGALEADSVSFRLSDNSWRETTIAELRELLTEYITRKRSVWASFAEWDEGDKSEDFEVTL